MLGGWPSLQEETPVAVMWIEAEIPGLPLRGSVGNPIA